MLEKCHFEEHVMQSGVPLQPKSVIRISLCRTTQRNPNDRFGLIVKKMRWVRICIYLRSLFRFGNRSSSALHVMAGKMSACGMSRSLNAIGCQTPCFFASNPMLLDIKLNAVGTWRLHVFVTCCVLLSWLLSPAFPQSSFGWMRHSACWRKTRRARRLPPSPRSLVNGNVLPRKKSFFGGSVSCRRKVLFMCGSINYHRQVFWGGSLFTFSHLVCSF